MQKFIILCSALPIFVACATLHHVRRDLSANALYCVDNFIEEKISSPDTSCEEVRQIFQDKKDECRNKDGASSDEDPCCLDEVLIELETVIEHYCPREQDNRDGAHSLSGARP